MHRDDVQALGLIIERQLRSVLSYSSKSKVSKENVEVDSDGDDKSCIAAQKEDVDLVPRKKVNKRGKGSELVHISPENETMDPIEYGAYRDFDEWF
jgi:hypothetical protein